MKKYDLAKIAASGQCFRMFPVDNKPGVFSIVAFGRYAELTTDPADTSFRALVLRISSPFLRGICRCISCHTWLSSASCARSRAAPNG